MGNCNAGFFNRSHDVMGILSCTDSEFPDAHKEALSEYGDPEEDPTKIGPDGTKPDTITADTKGLASQRVQNSNSAIRVRRTMGRSTSLKYMPGNEELSFRPPTEKTAAERELIAGSLRANPNLPKICPLSEKQIEMLVDVAMKDVVEEEAALMREGDLDSALFWVVASGKFEIEASEPFEVVTRNDFSYLSRPELVRTTHKNWNYSDSRSNSKEKKNKTVREIGRGCSFGDSSMLYGAPRWCTVTAVGQQCVVWAISQSNFKVVVQMGGDASAQTKKTLEDEKMIGDALKTNANLQRLAPLHDEHIKPLVRLAWSQELAKDEILMKEGDLNADALYIVSSGSLKFTGSEPFQVVQQGATSYFTRAAHEGDALTSHVEGPTVKTLGRGHCFGEISMLYCAPRFATVHAVEDSKFWALDRSTFQLIQMKAAEDEMRDRVKHLDKLDINILHTFSKDDKEKFAGIMDKLRLTKDEKLQCKGEVCKGLYILCEGSVEVVSKDGTTQCYEANPDEGTVHYFGKNALVRAEKSVETVVVNSPRATCLILGRDEFQDVCDRLLEAATSPAFTRYTTSATKTRAGLGDEYDINDMDPVGLLGCSRYGPINLVRHKTTSELFAKKDMNKALVVQRGLRKSIIREKGLWSEVTTPFIVRLITTYNESQTLSMLLEPAVGGELAWCYEKNNFYGSASHTKYYTAGVILALEHMHKRQIVYRNLKPQNILLSKDGIPKLTDMCLAKRVVGYTFTTCGTPTYMAPEIIRGSGHTRAVDWWTLGVLTFELMAGVSPFESDHPMEVYSSVMRGITRVNFPKTCSGPVGELTKSLLAPVAIDRLPMRQGGIQNIMDHEWFSGFDWASMRKVQIEPPFRPSMPQGKSADRFLTNFAPRIDRMTKPPVEYTPVEDGQEDWDEAFEMQEHNEPLEVSTY